MAIKKAQGRPKSTGAKTDKPTAQINTAGGKENIEQDGEGQNQEIEQNDNKDLASEKTNAKEKVVEVQVSTPEAKKMKPSEQRKVTHTVFVKGRAREMSKQAYEAVSKDPKLEVTLPKGSRLVEPNLSKPCKDC